MQSSTRVVTRRSVQRGCRSAAFNLDGLETQLEAREVGDSNVYVELDGGGRLTCRGGAARATVLAALAPSPPVATLLLEDSAAPSELLLRLRLASDAPPHAELTLWFDDSTLALLSMPFLTLRNIAADGIKNYSCHECGIGFDDPNPLKVHLFLKCQQFDRITFWRQCLSILSGARGSPRSCWSPSAPCASPAELEALAAAWGRSRDGHVCVYCGKLYSRKYGLKIHIRTHTGYKPLRCAHCLRAFGDPSNLNKHVRLHAAARGPESRAAAHVCQLCGKTLARRRDLQRHLRSHHSAEVYNASEPNKG